MGSNVSSKSVQDLIVKLVADGKEFKSSLETAGGNARKFANETNTAMSSSKKCVKLLTGVVASLAITIAGSSAAVLKLAADNAQAVTEMDRVAKSMDVNTTRFDKLAFAASQYGVGQDDFTQLLSDTSERITELVTIGSGEALDMFEQLNISVDEFKNLKPDEMFLKMMEALSQVSSQTERNLYLQQIAGDTGQRLSEVAEDGAKSFVELANSMGEYGGALSDDMIKESKELLEAMGIAVVQAPSEVEAEAAYLVKHSSDIYAVASQDYDSLLFGTPHLIQNLTWSDWIPDPRIAGQAGSGMTKRG